MINMVIYPESPKHSVFLPEFFFVGYKIFNIVPSIQKNALLSLKHDFKSNLSSSCNPCIFNHKLFCWSFQTMTVYGAPLYSTKQCSTIYLEGSKLSSTLHCSPLPVWIRIRIRGSISNNGSNIFPINNICLNWVKIMIYFYYSCVSKNMIKYA